MRNFMDFVEGSGVGGSEYWAMTRREFDRAGFWQHNVFGPDVEGGFRSGIGPNVVPATKGPPGDVMERRYGTRAGRPVYVVPREALVSTGNGMRVREGWVPRVRLVPRYDFQPLHELVVMDALERGVEVPARVLADYPSLVGAGGSP